MRVEMSACLSSHLNLTSYISLNSKRILVKFLILNLMTKPNKPYDTLPRLDPSIQGLYPSSQVYLTAYISLNSEWILVKFWIINLMINPNKPYDTTPCIDPRPFTLVPRFIKLLISQSILNRFQSNFGLHHFISS